MPDVTLLSGDCLALLRTLPDASVDACVTDPPAGIAFMGRDWDHDKGGRTAWIAWMTAVMREVHRVLKPGGHAFVWALPRTAHWTATALEDAGFEIRDKVYHLFGSGFPKSHDVSKAIDREAGAERAVIGENGYASRRPRKTYQHAQQWGATLGGADSALITAPATDLAQQWAGWGTALKPAAEEWILARKPLAGTVAATVAAWGTGALNIDAARVGTEKRVPGGLSRHSQMFGSNAETGQETGHNPNIGRWPPNVLLQHAPGCVPAGTRQVRGEKLRTLHHKSASGFVDDGTGFETTTHGSPDGTETVAAWICAPGCPIRELDRQSGQSKGTYSAPKARKRERYFDTRGTQAGSSNAPDNYGDTGGASRFYPVFTPDPPAPFLYCAKASRRERNAGCAGLPTSAVKLPGKQTGFNPATGVISDGYTGERQNTHPTVKPQALMRWLCTLITPPGGTILDPFCGSGSTGVAAVTLGYSFIGCEQDSAYLAIAAARLAHAQAQTPAAVQPALEMTA